MTAIVVGKPTEEDRALAEALVRDGWRSVSRRYRTVRLVRIPAFDDAGIFTEGAPSWLRGELRKLYEDHADRWWLRTGDGEDRTLTPEQFAAFKQAGGQTA